MRRDKSAVAKVLNAVAQLSPCKGRRLCALVAAGALALICGTAVSQPAAPECTKLEISGEPGKASEVRTLRFSGTDLDKLTFEVGHLKRKQPSEATIDLAQIQVTPAAAGNTKERADHRLAVTDLPERHGIYQGTVIAKSKGLTLQTYCLQLRVRPSSTAALTPIPPNLILPMASGVFPVPAVLTNWPTAASQTVSIGNLPPGVEVMLVGHSELMSTRGNGKFGGSLTVKESGGKGMLVELDAKNARPDRYTASAELGIVGAERRITLPIDISVRVSPWWVLGLLLLGIVLGQAAKWLNDEGQKLLAVQAAIQDFTLAAAGVGEGLGRHLDPTVRHLTELAASKRLAEFDAALAMAKSRLVLLERVASLLRLARERQATTQVTKLEDIGALASAVQESLVPLTQRLDNIAVAMMSNGGADQANGAVTFAREKAEQAAADRLAAWNTKVRRAERLRSLLQVLGVVLLAFVGYELLYINGSATFGANFSDYFGALLWGLGSEVAARTITSLGRVAPAKVA